VFSRLNDIHGCCGVAAGYSGAFAVGIAAAAAAAERASPGRSHSNSRPSPTDADSNWRETTPWIGRIRSSAEQTDQQTHPQEGAQTRLDMIWARLNARAALLLKSSMSMK